MSNAYIRTIASLALALVTFSGTLLDQTTGQPLSRVSVHAQGPSQADATTDAHGRFHLTALRPGTYTISVQSSDVPQQTFRFTLPAEHSVARTIKACSTTLDYHCGTPGGAGPG
jgi:Carboxypeptidase regulatory-like domain